MESRDSVTSAVLTLIELLCPSEQTIAQLGVEARPWRMIPRGAGAVVTPAWLRWSSAAHRLRGVPLSRG
ncbi:hypothetical protein [Nocardia cyriacigeorgica]|uniref:hypothetical protein n=1 Tax=Nocardia cyriacigeorgica TaxID=135487 RepID=UPI00189382F4|nr:hypothetical protein [Nocardia cyriacigeorgica]MBF6092261.1 hypothetical protein [Nocardia cyriacigeorgica]